MKALSIRDLKKTYDNGVEALKGISLDVEEGDFFALLGPNGAGKSTMIGIITSLVNKTSGTVKVFDTDIDVDFGKAKSHIGLVPQEFNCNIFEKVIHILVNQAGYYGIERKLAYSRAEHYLNKLELWHKRNDSPRLLSGGMKRRLMIARALINQPRLLILDEPTAGVDIEIRRSMWQLLQEINTEGTTIILTTHYLEEAESLCKNIAIINHGLIAEDTSMKELLKKLHLETFVMNLENPVTFAPELNGFATRLIDETTIEVDIYKEQPVNQVFQQLDDNKIKILSMRNKTNRLEELFLHITSNRTGGTNE